MERILSKYKKERFHIDKKQNKIKAREAEKTR